MKKIKLKKKINGPAAKRIGYKIDYFNELNQAQYEAVMHNNGAALVIAGAGTGKTRTLVYRVARLIEDGVRPDSILLLTFTRKASSEMLRRAARLLDGRCNKVSGGTFHSFALTLLRKYAAMIGYDSGFTVLDQSDTEDTINYLRSNSNFINNKRRFPRKNTLFSINSLTVNRRTELSETLEKEFPHFIGEKEGIETLLKEYKNYKQKYNLMDYDDLLVNFLRLLNENKTALDKINNHFKYTMVDEYQDTNRLQHEIVLKLAGKEGNVMAVGDDAQSIYSFRGADFQNIMFFPESYNNCKIYKIEQNYRSLQPLLNLTNQVIVNAVYKYEKELFTKRTGGEPPKLICAGNERQQSEFIVQQVLEYREQGVELEDMAVLFRSGFHSFDLEIELNKSNIQYKKFGGIKFIETAHIKDMIGYFRVIFNPRDAVSWQRILLLLEGIGPKTATGIIDKISGTDKFYNSRLEEFSDGLKENVKMLLKELFDLKNSKAGIGDKAAVLSEFYKPILQKKYDDWQRRWKDIEMYIQIAERYNSMTAFLNDMAVEPPIESVGDLMPEDNEDEFLTLSTIHSAKGLEWEIVIIIWALEGRFPSAKAAEDVDSLEEERRLFYVACTRAKDGLYITYPTHIFDRATGFVLSRPTRFLEGIDDKYVDKYTLVEESEEDEKPENNQ